MEACFYWLYLALITGSHACLNARLNAGASVALLETATEECENNAAMLGETQIWWVWCLTIRACCV